MFREDEISESGSLLVFKKGYSPDFVRKTIRARNLRGLRILALLKEDRVPDASFLRDFAFLEALDVTSRDDYDFSFLRELVRLKELSIYTEGKNEIDLSNLRNLESLVLQWRKGKIKGLEQCQKLSKLGLVEYKEADFMPIASLTRLKHLTVKTASVRTVNGLHHLKNLGRILLGNCPLLKSIGGLNGLKRLEYLEINLCSKIEDFDSLTDLPNLRELVLTDCKSINSVDFIRNFPKLESVSLLGTTSVLDGDLSSVIKVKDHFFSPKRHYKERMDYEEYRASHS